MQFTAPMGPGPVTATAGIHRSGRAVTQAHAQVFTDGQLAVSVLATIAADRPSDIHIDAPAPSEIAQRDACTEMPYIDGITPKFTQHFRYHWATLDSLPFQGGGRANIEGYVAFREPTVPTPAAVLALIDSWPAPVLGLVSRPIAASTVTWMVNLYAEPDPAPDQTYRYSSTATVAGNGYSDVDEQLWDSRGRLLATGRQFVAEFSGK
ncbi:MAG: acyl-CoA thioesterase [Myxococcota bacterium]|jgi:acyl-CoA thioesterase